MDENNNGQMIPQKSEGIGKSGLWLIIASVVLSLFSDMIPLPIDDVISVILAVLGGKNIFENRE